MISIMKTHFKNIVRYALILPIFLIGVSFANAYFHSDPAGSGYGFTSIGVQSDSQDSYSANIPNPGNQHDFSVYVDYQNIGSSTLYNVYAGVSFNQQGSSNSTSITGFLKGSGVSTVQDTTVLNNLPSSWTLEAVSARLVNTHNSSVCNGNYSYDKSVSISQATSSSGAYVGDLNTQGTNSNGNTGACSQGHLVVRFRVTNTSSSSQGYSWDIGDWGSCSNGLQTRNVNCVSSSGAFVSDSYCSAVAKPQTQRSCTSQSPLSVQTNSATNIYEDSAILRGTMISGNSQSTWFVYDDQPVTCSDYGLGGKIYLLSKSSGESFSYQIRNLESNNTYYFIACASTSANGTVSGGLQSFRTNGNGGSNGRNPVAYTRNPDNVDETSAELNGEIDMNSFNNGIVFFVYGQDRNDIENVEYDYDRYSQVRENGDDLRKILVDNDLDGNDNYSKYVYGLDTDERYYYAICVEYDNNGNDELECGGVEDFQTDDNNGNDDDAIIRTEAYSSVRSTSAVLCGNLINDGGNSKERTWIEYRRSTTTSWTSTSKKDRGEIYYCEDVNRLEPSTTYVYRACSDSRCDVSRTFRTVGTTIPNSQLEVNTLRPDPIYSTSATLRGSYIGDPNDPTQLWFNWGRTAALGNQKRSFTYNGASGSFQDAFTGLQTCTRYYYQAVGKNSQGTDYGDVISFRTGGCSTSQPVDEPEIEVVERRQTDIDLSRLGLGLSLIRLEIDDSRETVSRGERVTYEVTWENISTIDLNDIDIKVSIPKEVDITTISRGRADLDENAVLFTIDDLDAGEDGSMTVSGVIGSGTIGNLVTAEATAAFDNPINDAQENATDYDIDEYVAVVAGVTASVFGLRNITFLGWLTILLGLLIIFLIARWLYLEREELRAQAYANGYRPGYVPPRYDVPPATYSAPQPNQYPENLPTEDNYQPYRPNR